MCDYKDNSTALDNAIKHIRNEKGYTPYKW